MNTASPSHPLVLGIGLTGQSVARWLAARDAQPTFADTRADIDTSAVRRLFPQAPIVCGDLDDLPLTGIDTVIASPGIAPHHALLQRAEAAGLPVVSDVELFCREASAPIVAVTGSNGKSTVVSLLAWMCECAGVTAYAGANLGTPVLDLPVADHDACYLLELSSFQLQRTDSLNALVACVLNISPDHLDWHGDEAHYRAAKYRIYRHCEYAVVNRDEPPPAGVIGEDSVVIEFTLGAPHERQFGVRVIDGEVMLSFAEQPVIAVADCALRGTHNVANMLAALAIGSAIDLPLSSMQKALKSFTGLAHRHQLVAEHNAVRWINDSKATNIGAALASVAAVDGPVIVLLGGRAKGEPLDALAGALPDSVRLAIVYGENRESLSAALGKANRACVVAEQLPQAVAAAAEAARPGDSVLLAPAAASQDAYANYAERGEHFTRLVRALSP